MFGKLFSWSERAVKYLVDLGCEVKVIESAKSDNSSVRIDIDSMYVIARLAFWASGDFDGEVLNVKPGALLFGEDGSVSDGEDLDERLNGFMNACVATR